MGDLGAEIISTQIWNNITSLSLSYTVNYNLASFTIPIFDKSIGYAQRGNICSASLGSNLYVLQKDVGNYKIYVANLTVSIYNFESSDLNVSSTINFIDYKFHTDSSVNYLIFLTYRVDGEDSNKIIILSIDTSFNTATKLTFSETASFDLINISASELKCIKYNSNTITITLFTLTSTNATKSSTTYTYDLTATSPNPLPVTLNTLYTDSVNVDSNRFFFHGISAVSSNKYKYSLFLYDSIRDRSLDFSEFGQTENKENYIEDVLENEELKLNDDIIKFNKPLVFRKDKMIIAENSYNVYLYQHNDNLILKFLIII